MDDERLATVGYLGLLLTDFLLLLYVNFPLLYVDGVRQQAHAVRKGLCLSLAPGFLQGLILVHHIVFDVFGGNGATLGQIERVGLAEQADGLVVATRHRQIAGIGTDVIDLQIFTLTVLQIEGLGLVVLTIGGIDSGLANRYVVVTDLANEIGQFSAAVQTRQSRVAFGHQRQGLLGIPCSR